MLRLQTTKTKSVKNRYFVAFFLKSNVGHVFIDACRKISNIVVLLDDLNKLSLQDTVYNVCGSSDGGVSEDYILKYFKLSNFLICLMNHEDYSIAGFVYGHSVYKQGKPNKYNWLAFEIEVLCGHNSMKKVGFQLSNILKLLVVEIHKVEKKINGFTLHSVNVPSTLAFYDRQEIVPLDISQPLERFWKIKQGDLREFMKTTRMQMKRKTPSSFEFLDKSNTPETPRENFIGLLTERIFKVDVQEDDIISDDTQHPTIYKLSKKIKKLKTKKQEQLKKIQQQLDELINYGVDSEDKVLLEDFIKTRDYNLDGESLVSSYEINNLKKQMQEKKQRLKTRKLRPRYRDKKNPYDLLRLSSSSSSSTK